MKHALIIAIAVAVSGCAVQLNKVVASSEKTVVVQAISNDVAAAMKLANAECAKYGLKARMSGKEEVNYIFDCIN